MFQRRGASSIREFSHHHNSVCYMEMMAEVGVRLQLGALRYIIITFFDKKGWLNGKQWNNKQVNGLITNDANNSVYFKENWLLTTHLHNQVN